jgi:hypothetical protein
MRYLIALLPLFLAGCITTSLQPHMNPSYQGARYEKVAVGAPNLQGKHRAMLEDRLARKLQAKGILAAPMHTLFPPYKEWSMEEVRDGLAEDGFPVALLVQVGRSQGSSQAIAYQTTGSAKTVGNSVQASSWTVPIRSASRTTSSRATLIDVQANENVWVVTGRTEGRGTVYAGVDDAIKDLAAEYAQALIQTGLLAEQ